MSLPLLYKFLIDFSFIFFSKHKGDVTFLRKKLVVFRSCSQVQSLHDVIQKIEKTLDNTHATTQRNTWKWPHASGANDMSRLRILNSSLSRRDPVLGMSADIVNEVVKESATPIIQSFVDGQRSHDCNKDWWLAGGLHFGSNWTHAS